jgi:hypothetical protein
MAGEAMSKAIENAVQINESRATLCRPVTWNGGAAMIVQEDTAFGGFATIPCDMVDRRGRRGERFAVRQRKPQKSPVCAGTSARLPTRTANILIG